MHVIEIDVTIATAKLLTAVIVSGGVCLKYSSPKVLMVILISGGGIAK